jgi:hypothetical protein
MAWKWGVKIQHCPISSKFDMWVDSVSGSGKSSFVLWRVTQFFYLLCSQFRQKASGWINCQWPVWESS